MPQHMFPVVNNFCMLLPCLQAPAGGQEMQAAAGEEAAAVTAEADNSSQPAGEGQPQQQ